MQIVQRILRRRYRISQKTTKLGPPVSSNAPYFPDASVLVLQLMKTVDMCHLVVSKHPFLLDVRFGPYMQRLLPGEHHRGNWASLGSSAEKMVPALYHVEIKMSIMSTLWTDLHCASLAISMEYRTAGVLSSGTVETNFIIPQNHEHFSSSFRTFRTQM